MIAPGLPAELKAALDAKLQGLSRSEAAGRAAQISQIYRDGGGSGAIRSEADALAYALARMPATYAAVAASLNALAGARPGFAPKSLLDVGAGPGTATWAAAEAFSSLQSFALLDSNGALRALALDLGSGSVRLRNIEYEHREARAVLADSVPADLVVASYMIGETSDAERRALAELMWAKTRDTLLIVEPGTPAGYAQDHRATRATDRVGRACRSPLPARRQVSADGAGLVSFHAAPAPLARPQANQGSRASLRGRKIHLRRIDARAARGASRPRIGATRRQQGRGIGETLHNGWSCHRKGAAPRQSGLRPRQALAMGRRGDGRSNVHRGSSPRTRRPIARAVLAFARATIQGQPLNY